MLAQYDMCIYNVRYITHVARHFLLHCIYSGVQKQEGTKLSIIKGGFFSESAIRFSNLQNENIPNYYPELEI